jgi:hypothetical protein
MLGVGPKTLRNWLRHAHLQFVAHPTDARLKCLMPEQVQQLALLHARSLQRSATASSTLQEEAPALASSEGQTAAAQQQEAPPVSAIPSLSEEVDLRKAVCGLEAKVVALQEHLTQLTLELLHERSERYERRLSALEALLPHGPDLSPSPHELPAPRGDRGLESISTHGRRLLPAELHARSRVLPRVEYGAAGGYVLVCPREGALSFTPDSQEWFDWLACLNSFRFVGPQGRFTAYREGQRSWRAYRTFHGQNHKQSLGTTDRLTIARLEEVAGMLQARLT